MVEDKLDEEDRPVNGDLFEHQGIVPLAGHLVFTLKITFNDLPYRITAVPQHEFAVTDLGRSGRG